MKLCRVFLLVAGLCTLGTAYASAKDTADTREHSNKDAMVLVDAGQSRYTIVVSADATLPVKFAAEELQKYLLQMSCARLPIATDASVEPAILVGEGVIAPGDREAVQASLKDRGEDGYLMRSLGGRLILTGNSPRATLFAVYHFLEKLGCGWRIPGDDTVPRRTTIRLAPFNEAVGPPAFTLRKIVLFPYGYVRIRGGDFMKTHNLPHTDWAAKNRLNWVHPGPNGPGLWEKNRSREVLVPEVERRGLMLEVGGHTFNTFLPADRYGKTHPDYYALKADGARAAAADKNGFVSICLSNPDVSRQMAENINQWLDENPEVDCVDLWHDDQTVKDYCRCPQCTSASSTEAEAQAAYVKSYIRFTNQVAALVGRAASQGADQRPDVQADAPLPGRCAAVCR